MRLLEAVYQDALEKEFQARQIDYKRETEVAAYYCGLRLNTLFKADFVYVAWPSADR